MENYITIPTAHLRDERLSLKAKGLYTLMIALPEDIDRTNLNMTRYAVDGVDSVCLGMKELTFAGYIKREPRRRAKDAVIIGTKCEMCIPDIKSNPALPTDEFATIPNSYLFNKNLTLRAMGLMTIMLLCPAIEYEVQSLETVCYDRIAAISSTVLELVAQGYAEKVNWTSARYNGKHSFKILL